MTVRLILAPVPVDEKWLDDQNWPNENKIFIVGAGLNYGEHAKEVGGGDSILFPKPTVPTGAYAPVPLAPRVGRDDAGCLLDYEAEIAFVVLEDIDLANLPSGPTLWSKLAFFAVNDVTYREPIILDDQTGYTKGKARPGFLPSGPWLVAGWHLVPKTNEGGTEPLMIGLSTRDASDTGSPSVTRQLASSAQMIVGPRAILALLRDRDPQGEFCQTSGAVCAMDDVQDAKRYMIQGSTLPAGSIVLTGTPGGTALKAPGLFDKLGFLLRSDKDKSARQLFLDEQIRNRLLHGYLQPGVQVDQAVERLGRQTWEVTTSSPENGAVCEISPSL
jgi:2-keto-4-pentenoate hydratase/2-oxohepta-3-ene-1,7-dioic acid hydratase in catechol pathway